MGVEGVNFEWKILGLWAWMSQPRAWVNGFHLLPGDRGRVYGLIKGDDDDDDDDDDDNDDDGDELMMMTKSLVDNQLNQVNQCIMFGGGGGG